MVNIMPTIHYDPLHLVSFFSCSSKANQKSDCRDGRFAQNQVSSGTLGMITKSINVLRELLTSQDSAREIDRKPCIDTRLFSECDAVNTYMVLDKHRKHLIIQYGPCIVEHDLWSAQVMDP